MAIPEGTPIYAERCADTPDSPVFPLSHGIPQVDEQLIVLAMIFVIKNDLRWRDAPRAYGPHKTI